MDALETPISPNQLALSRFVSACRADSRILAARLYGSHARGAADEWSDLDIAVVIVDDAYDEFIAGREAFVRQLGRPLFIEDFDNDGIVFFMLADGAEGELSIDRESNSIEPRGMWRALVDKTGVLSRAQPRSEADLAEQVETLRRQIMWFWHDLSHFTTAMGRGQWWWAAGQLEVLRRICLNLARLRHDFSDTEVGDDPFFKVDKALPAEALAPLQRTFAPMERAAMLAAVRLIIDYYRELASTLAEEHGIRYPVELERLILARLARLAPTGAQ